MRGPTGSRTKSATRAETRAETGPQGQRPGSIDSILRLDRFTFVVCKCIIQRANQSATYLSEGNGHHELAAYSTVSDVQRRGPCQRRDTAQGKG
jgi:hypothetical protein